MTQKSPGYWFDQALLELKKNVVEIPGLQKNNERILWYWKVGKVGLSVSNDEVPWCSAFVCAMIELSDVSRPSTRSAAARSWMTWGIGLKTPEYGCITVLRSNRGPSSGHVGFYLGEDKDFVYLLGGNQNNSVSVGKYSKKMILSYRWPKNTQLTKNGPVKFTGPSLGKESSDA